MAKPDELALSAKPKFYEVLKEFDFRHEGADRASRYTKGSRIPATRLDADTVKALKADGKIIDGVEKPAAPPVSSGAKPDEIGRAVKAAVEEALANNAATVRQIVREELAAALAMRATDEVPGDTPKG